MRKAFLLLFFLFSLSCRAQDGISGYLDKVIFSIYGTTGINFRDSVVDRMYSAYLSPDGKVSKEYKFQINDTLVVGCYSFFEIDDTRFVFFTINNFVLKDGTIIKAVLYDE